MINPYTRLGYIIQHRVDVTLLELVPKIASFSVAARPTPFQADEAQQKKMEQQSLNEIFFYWLK